MNEALSSHTQDSRDVGPMADADERLVRDENVFTVLAERARGHRPAHLWGAALFGAADFVAVVLAYPSAWWIASGALALCAFGIWGLADNALIEDPYHPSSRSSRLVARGIRAGAVVLGVSATLGVVFGLFGASFSGLIH